MKSQIERAVLEYRMFQKGDKLVVGLSGGADSVALTHVLRFAFSMEVIACHLNHGLRGAESERDMRFVQELCQKWEIPLYCKTVDVSALAKKQGLSVEQAGRAARYAFFEEVRAKTSAQKIATAHTLSDSLETLLFFLTRGTAHKGLCGVPPVRGNTVRPLIFCTRQDVERYCKKNSLSFVTDSSNFQDNYSRNKLRHGVVPVLKELNPAVEKSVGRTMEILREEEDYLAGETAAAEQVCKENDGLNCQKLRMFHPVIRQRMLVRFLEENGQAYDYELISKLEQMTSRVFSRWELSPDITAVVRKGQLFLENTKQPLSYFERDLRVGDRFIFEDARYEVLSVNPDFWQAQRKIQKNLSFTAMDYDTINNKLIFRQKKAGDCFSPSHRNGSKTVKKLLTEMSFSAYEKSALPVLSDAAGVVAVWSLGVDKRCAVNQNTTKILWIQKTISEQK